MKRRTKITAIVFGTFVFLGISFLLAQALTGAGGERSRVVEILRAQARGDAGAVLKLMPPCQRNPTCASVTAQRVQTLKRPGQVQILNFEPSAQAAFVNQTGSARVVWRTTEKTFPVVQCVVVRRQGPLTGGGVVVSSISNPIGLEASCGG
ncbi:MAG: hypothetical protein QOF76_600 [Solirubrobacteraceae bacterium]|jgi:hypothetical protein|nr:hypothetical protein [Solirubrobacteraceae bacterium]